MLNGCTNVFNDAQGIHNFGQHEGPRARLRFAPSCINASQSIPGDINPAAKCVAMPGKGTHNLAVLPNRICHQKNSQALGTTLQ